MSDRLSDEQFDELHRALGYMYEVDEPPAGCPEWIKEFLGPDGGHLNSFAAWREERERFATEQARAEAAEEMARWLTANRDWLQVDRDTIAMDAMRMVRHYCSRAETAEQRVVSLEKEREIEQTVLRNAAPMILELQQRTEAAEVAKERQLRHLVEVLRRSRQLWRRRHDAVVARLTDAESPLFDFLYRDLGINLDDPVDILAVKIGELRSKLSAVRELAEGLVIGCAGVPPEGTYLQGRYHAVFEFARELRAILDGKEPARDQ